MVLGIRAEPGQFLSQLSAGIAANDRVDRQPWIQKVQAKHSQPWSTAERRIVLWEATTPMMPQQLYRELQTLLPADAIVILEGNINLSYGQFIF